MKKYKWSRYYAEIYYVLLSILYFLVIRHTWYFRKVNLKTGLTYDFNFPKYLLVSIFVLFTIFIYKKMKVDYFSKNVLGLILILYFIPASIFYSSVSITPFIYFAITLIFYTLYGIFKIRYEIKLPILNKKQSLILLIAIIIIGAIPFIRYIHHISIKNLFLIDVYSTRFKFRMLFDAYSSYTHSWLTRVIIPIVFVFSLKYKLKLLAIGNFMLLLILFLMGAVKSVLLGSLLVILFYFIPARRIYNYMLLGLIAMAMVAIICVPFLEADLNTVAVLIFRRLMFIPSLLDYCYFEFFESNYLYWSNGFLKAFLDYPYEATPPRLIGEFFFDRPDIAANNGIVSDGFANAGFLGVIVNIGLLSVFFSVIKNCNVDSRFFGIYFFFIYNIFTTTFSTVLITHGGLILIILTVLVLRKPYKKLQVG